MMQEARHLPACATFARLLVSTASDVIALSLNGLQRNADYLSTSEGIHLERCQEVTNDGLNLLSVFTTTSYFRRRSGVRSFMLIGVRDYIPTWEGLFVGLNGVAEIVGGVADHVHLLASLRPVHRIADVMRELKKDSSTWVKDNFDRSFVWQEGYAAFTVSPLATEAVKKYIANQEAHHARYSFVDELKEMLAKAGIEYDEKYLL